MSPYSLDNSFASLTHLQVLGENIPISYLSCVIQVLGLTHALNHVSHMAGKLYLRIERQATLYTK